MKVIVGVKRISDYNDKPRVKEGKLAVDHMKLVLNPFCEIAIEEAVRLKEKKVATEIVAVTIGNKKAEECLRTAMALGADKAIHIVVSDAEAASIEPLAVAKIFAKLQETEKADIWILGKQAVDGDFGITPQLLAGLLDIPQGTFCSGVQVEGKTLKVTRELDAGNQVISISTPCVLAADLRLNTPRFAALPNIMKARKKPIDTRDVASFGVDLGRRLEGVKVAEPAARKAGIKVGSVQELFDKLKNEAKVI